MAAVLSMFFLVLLGLAGGLAVGSGFVAFLSVLDIIPRLAQITKTARYIHAYEWFLITGAVFWTVTDLFDLRFSFSPVGTAMIGWFDGIFVGMLAAALTEVLNVFPILARRLHIHDYIIWFLMAMVFGKVFGSLFDWLVYHSS